MHKVKHKVLILIPVLLAGCMAAGPDTYQPYTDEVAPVTRSTGWAGCEAEGGTFHAGDDGGLVCVAD